MKKYFPMATLLVIVFWSVVYAQQQEPSLKPSMAAPRAAEGPPPLLLEVAFNPAMPPGYSSVNGPTELGKWLMIGRFVRIPGAPQLSPPVTMVKVEPQFNGETAAVRVTLIRGARSVEREDFVGIYRLGVGEQKTLNDLRDVGIEPFKITLLDTVPPVPPPPTFENKTKAIEIVSVRSENLPNPAYILTLRNLSEKNVIAVGLDLTSDKRPGSKALFHGEEERPLITAGGAVEQYVRVVMPQRTPTGFAPSVASANQIRIRTAVFSDLSYEGDVLDACLMESSANGHRIWLTAILSLLDQQLTETFTDHIETARQFKQKVEALNFDSGDGTKPSAVSPACVPISQTASAATAMKLTMLRDLDQIINTRPRPPFSFREWMETRRATYTVWLARF